MTKLRDRYLWLKQYLIKQVTYKEQSKISESDSMLKVYSGHLLDRLFSTWKEVSGIFNFF